MDSNLTDDHILAFKIRNDSLEAFEILYNRYKKKLYCFSLKYLNNSYDAEEIVQIVFISLWENRQNIDDTKLIKNYIYRSAVNLIYNHLKKLSVRSRFIEDELPKHGGSVNQTIENLFYEDLKKRLEYIIASLPAQQQKIFYLSRIAGLSHAKIASNLGLSVRTVENQIYRVTKILKRKLNSDLLI